MLTRTNTLKVNFKITAVTSTLDCTAAGVSVTNDTLTVSNHGLKLGDNVALVVGTNALPTGLATETAYYIIPVNENQFKLASSLANAKAGTAVNITAAGTSTDSTIYKNGFGLAYTGVRIPNKAVVTNAFYVVRSTFTGTSDAATIAIGTGAAANDLVVGIAISAAGDVYDAGIRGILAGSFAARTVAGDTAILDAASKSGSCIVMAASNEVIFTSAVKVLTAGELDLYISYIL